MRKTKNFNMTKYEQFLLLIHGFIFGYNINQESLAQKVCAQSTIKERIAHHTKIPCHLISGKFSVDCNVARCGKKFEDEDLLQNLFVKTLSMNNMNMNNMSSMKKYDQYDSLQNMLYMYGHMSGLK